MFAASQFRRKRPQVRFGNPTGRIRPTSVHHRNPDVCQYTRRSWEREEPTNRNGIVELLKFVPFALNYTTRQLIISRDFRTHTLLNCLRPSFTIQNATRRFPMRYELLETSAVKVNGLDQLPRLIEWGRGRLLRGPSSDYTIQNIQRIGSLGGTSS